MLDNIKLYAAGPWFQGRGDLPHRVVLRVFLDGDKPIKYVTHTETVQGDGRPGYHNGHYFETRGVNPEPLQLAFEDWRERTADHVRQYAGIVEQGYARCLTEEEARSYRYGHTLGD